MTRLTQHTQQPGWFDLLSVIVDRMLQNAGEAESYEFLQHVGEQLAVRFPLKEALTVQALEMQMNLVLARFNWGFVDIQPQENALLLTHEALPAGDGWLDERHWQGAMGAVLTGLYLHWLHEQGGSRQVPLICERATDGVSLCFRYQNRRKKE